MAKTLGVDVREIKDISEIKPGEIILKRGDVSGAAFGGMTVMDMQTVKNMDRFDFSSEDVAKAQKAGVFNRVSKGTLQDMISSGIEITRGEAGADDIARAAYGKSMSDLSKDELMKLEHSLKGTVYESVIKKTKEAARISDSARDAATDTDFIKASKDYHSAAGAIRSHVGDPDLTDDAVQLLAHAANLPSDSPEQKAALEEATLEIVRGGKKDISEAREMTAKGLTLGKTAKDLATSHSRVKASQEIRGSSALTKQLTYDVSKSGMSTEESVKALSVVEQIALAKTPEDFQRVVSAESAVISKLGASGRIIQKTDSILNKVEKGLSSEDFKSELQGIGISPDQHIMAALEKGDFKAVRDELLSSVMRGQASDTVVTGSGAKGAALDGGPSPSETLAQQVNINNQILQAMSAIAQKLGAR
jgi:hypothetical protein